MLHQTDGNMCFTAQYIVYSIEALQYAQHEVCCVQSQALCAGCELQQTLLCGTELYLTEMQDNESR